LWPFNNNLKEMFLSGWFIYAAISVILLAMVMIPAISGQISQWQINRLINVVVSEESNKQPLTAVIEDDSKDRQENSAIQSSDKKATLERAIGEEKQTTAENSRNKENIDSKEKQPVAAAGTTNKINNEQVILTNLARPVEGAVITGYGEGYSELYQDYRFHDGLDFAAKPGSQVKAAAKGTVAAITEDDFGVTIIIEQGTDYTTRYSCLSQAKVVKGQSVKPGDLIGTVGSGTGDLKDTHLHFSLLLSGKITNPTPFFDFN
jgi:murein DD-endopeptidase MepM/ murein hydrolase activator NlpD